MQVIPISSSSFTVDLRAPTNSDRFGSHEQKYAHSWPLGVASGEQINKMYTKMKETWSEFNLIPSQESQTVKVDSSGIWTQTFRMPGCHSIAIKLSAQLWLDASFYIMKWTVWHSCNNLMLSVPLLDEFNVLHTKSDILTNHLIVSLHDYFQ